MIPRYLKCTTGMEGSALLGREAVTLLAAAFISSLVPVQTVFFTNTGRKLGHSRIMRSYGMMNTCVLNFSFTYWNFYMAGHWVMPGGGHPMVLVSGRWAIQLIRKREHKDFNANREDFY
jgi:hypothetical protein